MEDKKILIRFKKSLRAYAEQMDQMRTNKGYSLDGSHGDMVVALLEEMQKILGKSVPKLDLSETHYQGGTGDWFYRLEPIRAWVGIAQSVVDAELEAEEVDAPSAVTEKRDFSFVGDKALQVILERDYEDIQKAFVTGSHKAAIILSGGAIEALLLDQLQRNPEKAMAAKAATGKPKSIDEWDLHTLIEVALENGLVGPGVGKLSHSVRSFRNLVHPGREIRDKLRVEREEARIAVEILNMVQRDLRP